MKQFRKVAALCAVFLLSLCFCNVAFAVEEPAEPHTPAIATTESAIPEGEAAAAPTDEAATVEEPPAETTETEPVTVAPEVAEAAGIDPVPPAGTGTVIETATGADGREFYTITTPAGNVFYLIIDFTRQAENVYFLDAVTEKDLLALAEKSEDAGIAGAESTNPIPGLESDSTPTPEPTPGPQAGQEQEPQDNNTTNIILIVVVVAVFGGAAFYFKVYRKRKDAGIQDEYEADELDDSTVDEYEADEPEPDYGEYTDEGQEDDSLPWDEDDSPGMVENEDEDSDSGDGMDKDGGEKEDKEE